MARTKLTDRDCKLINMSPAQYEKYKQRRDQKASQVKKEGRTQLVGYATRYSLVKTATEARSMDMEKLRGLVEAHRERVKADVNGFQAIVNMLMGPPSKDSVQDSQTTNFTVLVKFEVEATSQDQANRTVIGSLKLLDNDERDIDWQIEPSVKG